MKIGFTFNISADYIHSQGEPDDADAEFDRNITIDKIAKSLEEFGHEVIKIGSVKNVINFLSHPSNRADLIFNIAEGISGRNRESQVPLLLELYDIPYVGADALTQGLTLDKLMTKKILTADKINTPRYFQIYNSYDIPHVFEFSFPMIVKPRWEGSSKSIIPDSIVNNRNELIKQVDRIHKNYDQPALVEEFIKGNEYTVVIIGNTPEIDTEVLRVKIGTHPPTGEEIFLSNFTDTDDVEYVIPSELESNLKEQILKMAVATFVSVDCRDFGRVDFRVDEQGTPFVLEINTLPSLDELDAFSMYAKHKNISYAAMIHKIVNAALNRYEKN